MRKLHLLALAVVVFILALVWFLPLRAVIGADDLTAAGVQVAEAEGRVWDGVLRQVRFGGAPLGDVGVKVALLPLLTGVQRVSLASGAVQGTVLQGRVRGVEGLTGAAPLSALASGTPLDGSVRLEDATLTFTDGGCRRGDGRATATVSVGAGGPPVTLGGGIACQGDAGVATLRTLEGSPRVDAVLRVEGEGAYRLTSTVATTDLGTRTALQLAGFQPGPGGLVRTDSGRLGRRAVSAPPLPSPP